MEMKPSRVDIDNIKIETGKRTYFINAVATSNGKKYIKISERLSNENGTYFYDKVIIHEEDMDTIFTAINKVLKHFKINNGALIYKSQSPLPNFKNTNKPWDAKDDLKLEKLYCKRKTVEELSAIFERNQTAIVERIEKLGLAEKYDFDVS
jgi:hypothetical protein